MKNNSTMNGGSTKLILLHPYIQKQGSSNRLLLISIFSTIFTVAFLLTFIYSRESLISTTSITTSTSPSPPMQLLPKTLIKALLHYASNSNNTDRMSSSDIKPISDSIRNCPSSPCNFLVFGLTHETLLWKALNHNGRTVFIDENRYYAASVEEKFPELEVYDVQYTTKMKEARELVAAAKDAVENECRPVQNLLFSDCKLGLNDLPNGLYEVDWDLILVDGPRGYWADGPGRMMSIFTAGVLARSKKGSGGVSRTHVFVHDYNRKVDKFTADEFLCRENLVMKSKDMLGHFVVERMEEGSFRFCKNHTYSSSSLSSSRS